MSDELPKVVMSSEEFGTEDFEYDSIEEAKKGFKRLKKECAKAYKKDGIERRLLLVIEDWETGDET